MSLFDKKFRLGVYEKAIPTELNWTELGGSLA